MYVAITRARRRLYMTFAQSRMLHGKTNYSMVSSFMRELPEPLLLWLSPRFVQRAPSFSSPSYSGPAYGGATYGKASPAPFAMPSSAPRDSGALWHVGQQVFHQKFGEGMVTDTEGSGNEGRVQVNFKRAGSKWLSLEYAKLEVI